MKNEALRLLIFITVCLTGSYLQAQNYCGVNYTAGNFYISEVQFAGGSGPNGWTNTTNGRGNNGYSNFTGNSNYYSLLQLNTQYDIRIKTNDGQGSRDFHVKVHFDWNDDGTFEDVLDLGVKNDPYEWSGQITTPSTGNNVITRMRVVMEWDSDNDAGPDATACDNDTYGEAEDYAIEICDGTTMQLNGVSVSQNNTNSVGRGTANNEIIGFNINTTGCSNGIVLRSANFTDASSTNISADVASAKLYYTGSSNVFSTGSEVGSGSAGTSFNIANINASLPELPEGDNWFWLAYDIDPNAQIDNYVDAALTSIVLDTNNANNVNVSVNNGNPAGKRLVVNSYCEPEDADGNPSGDGAHITNVAINDLDNASGFTPYFNYVPSIAAFDACVGATYNLAVGYNITVGYIDGQAPLFIHAYFDWNRDGDFTGSDEHYLLGNDLTLLPLVGAPVDDTVYASITPPQHAIPGTSVMRVVISRRATEDPCLATAVGETEDYGYMLHHGGAISLSSNTPICEAEAVDLVATSTPAGFDYQQSMDRIQWNTITGSTGQTSITTSPIDTTTYFRLASDNASCPTGKVFSDIVDVPFVGISSVQATDTAICLGDTTSLQVKYEYNKQVFEETGVNTIGNQPVEIALEVNNVSPKLNSVTLDSVCINAAVTSGADRAHFVLYAPDINEAEQLVLSSGNGTETIGAPQEVCFVRQDAPNVTTEDEALSGTYTPEESLKRFDGINPNGTWKLMAVSGYIDGNIVIDAFRLHFGVNDTIKWLPTDSTSATAGDSISVFPSQTTTYSASVLNKYCGSDKGIEIEVFEDEPITVTILKDPNKPTCDGEPVQFTANVENASKDISYQWQVNGQDANGETQQVFSSTNLIDGDEVTVSVNTTTPCGTYSASASVIVATLPVLAPSLTVSSDRSFPICEGLDATFTCDTADFGSGAVVEWKVNGALAQTGGTLFSPSGLNHLDEITAVVTGSYQCLTTDRLDESIVYETFPRIDPAVILDSDLDGQTICQNTPVSITADTALNDAGGNGTLQWFYNGTAFSHSDLTFEADTFSEGQHVITVVYNVSNPCSQNSAVQASVSFEVADSPIPRIQIAAYRTRICAGEEVSFTITQIENAGPVQNLQWLINGTPVAGETGNTFTSSTLNNNDEINIRLETSLQCAAFPLAFATPIKIRVSNIVNTEIRILPENADAICSGEIFTASVNTLEGGGANPEIEWFVNGQSVQRDTRDRFSIADAQDGDIIEAVLHTNVTCPSDAQPTSNPITVNVNPLPETDFTIIQESDESYTFTPADLSLNAYAWDFGDGISSQVAAPNHKFDRNGNYDVCLVGTSTNLCTSMYCETVSYITSVSENPAYNVLKAYPNPTTGRVVIELPENTNDLLQLDVLDNRGRNLTVSARISVLRKQITVDLTRFATGVYTIKVQTKTNIYTQRVKVIQEY